MSGGRRKYTSEHKRTREALLPYVVWGETKCCRCFHPLEPGAQIDLDHEDQGPGYKGWSHHSPCQVCGRRCNLSAGGQLRAQLAGQRPRERACVICGMRFLASKTSQETCAQRSCITEIRRLRREHEPSPEPPPQQGRAW